MDQRDLFDEEEGKSKESPEGDEFEGLDDIPPAPKKDNRKLLLGIGVLLIVGAFAANMFLSGKGEEPQPETAKRIPIKAAPPAVPAPAEEAAKPKAEVKEKAVPEAKKADVKPDVKKKEEVKAVAKKEEAPKPKAEAKPEVKKLVEVKVAKEEAQKPKTEAKVEVKEKPAKKEAPKAEVKKAETKPEVKKPAEKKAVKKETAKPKTEVKAVVKKEKPAAKEVKGEKEEVKAKGATVIIGTFAARYEVEAAEEKLKGTGIRYSVKETRKTLAMNRVLAKEVQDKGEIAGVVSDLKAKGYDPFVMKKNGGFKIYAVSNFSEEISKENKADLEKLGYSPSIEYTETIARAYELVAHPKTAKEAKELAATVEKLGFKPEIAK